MTSRLENNPTKVLPKENSVGKEFPSHHNDLMKSSEEWVHTTLKHVSAIKTGTKNNQDKDPAGKYPFFVRSAHIERIKSASYDGEAILIPGEGGIGSIFHYVNGKHEVHQRVYRISNFSTNVSAKFLYFYLKNFFGPYAMKNSVKATVDSLRLPTFLEFPILMPPTFSEQERIVAALDDVHLLVDSQNELIAKKRLMKQGAMQQLLTGLTRLPGFKGDWTSSHLGDIGTFRGGTGFPLHFQGSSHGEIPFFKVSDMNIKGNESRMLVSNNSVEASQLSALGASPFEAGSIVFAKVGAAVFLERKRLLIKSSCLDNNMAGFSLDNGLNDPQFFFYWFQGFHLSDLVAATALPSINNSQLNQIEASYPKLEEQLAIAKVLSDMDAEIDALVARRDKTVLMKTGMMQDLLTGKVRI